MNGSQSKQALLAEGGGELRWNFDGIATLTRALVALVFWSLLLGAVCFCYELRRLAQTWRLGIAR